MSKTNLRRGYRQVSIQAVGGDRFISGYPVNSEDERPVKNLNGKPTRKVKSEHPTAYFRDSQKYWRRTDTTIDVDFDNLCVATHSHIRRSILSEAEFAVFHDRIPDWVHMAGLEPESRVTKKQFEQLLAGSGQHEILHKFLYLHDVQGLLTNMQRTSAQISQVIGEFYGLLNDCEPYHYRDAEKVGLRSSVSAETSLLHAHLETIFVRMRSLLDYSVKLMLEVERQQVNFSDFVKLRGGSKQYSDKKDLQFNDAKGSIFVKDELIWMICSIRDRIVHDGHLDVSARVYESFSRRRLIERFVLIPDMADGRFESHKNRGNFYGRDYKINLHLPSIYDEFFKRMFHTIGYIHNSYAARRLE